MATRGARPTRPQKNFLKVPEAILGKVRSLPDDEVVVAAVVKIAAMAIVAGEYGHLDMTLEGERPVFPSEVIPKRSRGRYSRRNVEGKVVVRRDLPKFKKTFSVEAPTFGDTTNTHTVYFERDVYPRDFLPPKELALQLELLGEAADEDGQFLFRAGVGDILDRRAAGFEDDLLYDLNLLQENVGAVDVFPSSASREDYLRTMIVLWDILPPGTRDEVIPRVLARVGPVRDDVRAKIEARFAVLASLRPQDYIVGTNGFRRYFGARFRDDLVVFEHLDYGNAIYVMGENWPRLTKLSRLELLSSDRSGFERIIHRAGWEKRLRELIDGRRNPPAAAA
jgi:hypothetical protein